MRLPSPPAHLVFLIPFGETGGMPDTACSVTSFPIVLPLVASCNIVTMNNIGPDALDPALDPILPNTHGVEIISTDHPRRRDTISQLCESGVQVVTIASDLPKRRDRPVWASTTGWRGGRPRRSCRCS